ncbi:hypothetical protein B5G50_15555 [Brevibacillus brevis]|uniref:hypothetical protein n=1 Tax=Brevibacillus brevis TaxID=1393 RepID=UPI000B39CFAD|nr:hypothetical protein [Brevibacillus brevis]OUQ87427.1 hypothetical protein B5G50_15555 [Brevibacillus brevis]
MKFLKSVVATLTLCTALSTAAYDASATTINQTGTSSGQNEFAAQALVFFQFEEINREFDTKKWFKVPEEKELKLTVTQWTGGWFNKPALYYVLVDANNKEVETKEVEGTYKNQNHTVSFGTVKEGYYKFVLRNVDSDTPVWGNAYAE